MPSSMLGWLRGRERGARRGESGAPTLAVVGLGNPGPKYAGTRHNAGYNCVDLLADRLGARFSDKRKAAVLAEGRVEGSRVVLVKPRTFMNASGEAARYVLDRYRIAPAAMLIVLDDLDLPVGGIRMRASGGSGGHNGLNSINEHLGTNAYPRLRIGIGRPQGETISHVLTGFDAAERPAMAEAVARAADAVEAWLRNGVDYAMNHYN